jgi:hypothetical protein
MGGEVALMVKKKSKALTGKVASRIPAPSEPKRAPTGAKRMPQAPNDSPLDRLGRFVMERARDRGLASHTAVESGNAKAPALGRLVNGLAALSEEQRVLVRACVTRAVDATIHHLLFALSEENDFERRVRLLVDDENAAELSDGLQGEAYGNGGWIARFSVFDENGDRRR